MRKVRNLKEFVKIYPDDDGGYIMDFGKKYRGQRVRDVPTDYFDWAIDVINEQKIRKDMSRKKDNDGTRGMTKNR